MKLTHIKQNIKRQYESNIFMRFLFYIPISVYPFLYIWIKRSFFERFFSYRYYHTSRVYRMNDLTIGIKKLGKCKTKFPHPLGIVIGTGVAMGNNCTIYQNVTIGAKSQEDANKSKYPKIGNNVIIGSHALIIGDISIGDNVVVGAGSFINSDIPDNSVVVGNPFKILKRASSI